jgi:hypothetical protein
VSAGTGITSAGIENAPEIGVLGHSYFPWSNMK